ncbi:MAG: helix-turn-helix domain-containing protein, partial [Streptosporangiaceae bacterium]
RAHRPRDRRPGAQGGRGCPVSAGRRWPLVLIAAPAAVAVWAGWVGLGTLCGFGIVHPLPGIVSGFRLDTAITLPVGVEAYGAYALGAWLAPGTPPGARRFAKRSALGALGLGMTGQVIYHLLAAAHAARAPWPVVMLVACLPVLTLGMAAALTHLRHAASGTGQSPASPAPGTTEDATAAITPDGPPAIDLPPVPRAVPGRQRAPHRTGTAVAVARLRQRHPGMPVPEIARRLGVSDRTVRRHLAAHRDPPARAA